MQLGFLVEKNQAHSVDQYWLQALQFLVHLISLLSILLRCNDFAGVQKVVVNQTGSRPPNSDHDFFGCKFGLGKCFGASFWSSHWAGHLFLYTIHFLSHITVWSRNGLALLCRIREDNTSEQWCFNFRSAHEAPTRRTFSPSNLLQMLNNRRLVSVEFLSNFSWSCKRISLDDYSKLSLSTSDSHSLCFSSSRLSSPLQNFITTTPLYIC